MKIFKAHSQWLLGFYVFDLNACGMAVDSHLNR